jgi:nucleoside-diphosphate-sugar epimerase
MTGILVTGASGFLGRAVTAALASRGDAVRAAVRRPPQPAFDIRVEVALHPDLSETFDWQPLLEGVDRVVHLAAIAHADRGIPAEDYDRINRAATARLAGAAARSGVQQFVFVSSIRAQCGPSADHVLSERDEAAPTDAYGRSKLAAEAAVRAAGVPFTILRPVLLYGPGVKGNFARLLRAAHSPWPLPVKGFGNRRSLLGVDNFLSALRFVLSTKAAIGETYIVADPGMPLRLAELMATMRGAAGRRPLMLPLPSPLLELPLRALGRGETWQRLGGELRADPAKLLAVGWRPPHDTSGGIAALVQAETGSRNIMPPSTPTPNT